MGKDTFYTFRQKLFLRSVLLLGIFLFAAKTNVYSQHIRDRSVSGIVVDETGQPLPGAHVKQVLVSEGESIASVATDINGHFRLTVRGNTEYLEVSFIGYDTKNVQLNDNESYQITLQPTAELLTEIVVTGYQTLSRERVTGSFTKVNSEKLELKSPNSLSNLLEGEIAGYNRGLIRGTTSMRGMTTPLYVVDGFPVENTRYSSDGYYRLEELLPDMNIEDIDNITVLKDAAAASIYGARAANGVIVITTKKAARGETRISLSSNLTVSPYRHYTGNLANAAIMVDIEREWAANNPNLQGSNVQSYAESLLSRAVYNSDGIRTLLKGYAGQMSQQQVDATLLDLSSRGYRYYDDVEKYAKRDAVIQQYNLSLSKGTEQNQFNASLTYRNDRLSDIHSGNESVGVNIFNRTDFGDKIRLELGTWLNFGSGKTQTYSPLSPGYNYLPYNYLMNNDGSHFTRVVADRTSESYQQTLNQYGLYNMDITPLDEIGMNHRKSKDFSSRSFARLSLQFTPWLK